MNQDSPIKYDFNAAESLTRLSSSQSSIKGIPLNLNSESQCKCAEIGSDGTREHFGKEIPISFKLYETELEGISCENHIKIYLHSQAYKFSIKSQN